MQQTQQPSTLPQSTEEKQPYVEYRYRWVIVLLMGLSLIVNGMGNGLVAPIASKLASVYQLSTSYVSSPVVVSFLVYSLVNFPANHLTDTRGLRVSFLIGNAFYTMGLLLYVMVSKAYYYAILGSIFIAIGQPFIINCPAKVATFWFLHSNRTLATSIMTALLFLGVGIGFVLPPLLVGQDSTGAQAENQIFYLYAGEFLFGGICFGLVCGLMKEKPPTPPSLGARQPKTSLKQSISLLRQNRRVWVFFVGYFLLYGVPLSFISVINLLFKPYGLEDLQISAFTIVIVLLGMVGSLCASVYIKLTLKYGFALKVIATMSLISMVLICAALSWEWGYAAVLMMGGVLGLSYGPIVPISYDLGCELCFPVGEAQVIGILNGGAMLFTFLLTLITTSTISFSNTKDSLIVMMIFIVIMGLGTGCYYLVKIDLKRRKAEEQGHTIEITQQMTDINPIKITLRQTKSAYEQFIQQKQYK